MRPAVFAERNASKMASVNNVAARGSMPPVSPFERHMASGVMPACSQAKSGARATEARHDLVGDQERAVSVARRARRPHHLGRDRSHARGALHDRLEDKRRDVVARVFERRVDGGGVRRDVPDLEEQLAELAEERIGIAHGHRPEGVAVVALLEREEDPPRSSVAPAAGRVASLERHLDRRAAVVAVEDAREAVGRGLGQALGQPHGRLVRAAGEQHVVERARLGRERRHEVRMAVAVQAGPPGRYGVEQAAAVGELEPGASARATGRNEGARPCCV